MQLSKVQQKFKSLMLDHPDALKNPPNEFTLQFDAYGTPLPERLKIYRNNIVNSITEALADKLPTCEALVGREFLIAMCRSFALENPPEKGCLNHYGTELPAFIVTFTPAKALPYLADMAALELAMNAAYYAVDDIPLRADDFAIISQDKLADMHLKLRANIRVIQSRFPLLDIKAFCESDQNGELDISAQGGAIMVSRTKFEVQLYPLQEDEAMMLEALIANQTLGEAVQHVLAKHSAFDFGSFLTKHIELETFLRFESNR